MIYSKDKAIKLIDENKYLVGKNIFKSNQDIRITDVIVAPKSEKLFNEFIKDYTNTINFQISLNKLNDDSYYRVLVVSFNQFDNMLYYQDLEKFKELVYEH